MYFRLVLNFQKVCAERCQNNLAEKWRRQGIWDQIPSSFGLLISIRSFIWYIKVHNIPSSLLSLTSLSSHLKHLIILIFLKLGQFSQYMHCNPFLYHAMLAPFQSYLNFFRNSWLSLKLVSYFLFLHFKIWFQSQILWDEYASNIHRMNALLKNIST